MEIVEYDPSRRADIADLMGRVWGARPADAELEWFYERNPVRPASVLLGEEDGKVVATVAIAFLRMSIAGRAIEVGMPLRVATDPAYQGRGIFRELQAANEERVRGLGIRLLLTVPNAASAPVFVNKLGWTPLPSLRVFARARIRWRSAPAHQVARFGPADRRAAGRSGPCAPRRGLAQLALRRRADAVHAARGSGLRGREPPGTRRRGRGRGGRAAPADRPRGRRARRDRLAASLAALPLLARRLHPDAQAFTVLGKSLHPGQPVPPRPHFELGDLDFF